MLSSVRELSFANLLNREIPSVSNEGAMYAYLCMISIAHLKFDFAGQTKVLVKIVHTSLNCIFISTESDVNVLNIDHVNQHFRCESYHVHFYFSGPIQKPELGGRSG